MNNDCIDCNEKQRELERLRELTAELERMCNEIRCVYNVHHEAWDIANEVRRIMKLEEL